MNHSVLCRRNGTAAFLFVFLLLAGALRAAEPIPFTQESLPNGLRVIYAPMRNAPVVHVRVIYHVGSKNERPDRQGFAHMFEHMMFRGSAHVKPEEHMKLIGMVGGNSNAFTSFDQTVYVNTLPSNQLELALYLEADRMASFKVSREIYATERNVVAEEWRMKQNRPYANIMEDLLKTAFTTHPYRWTPIGNMQHLQAADAGELQQFFNTYYVPDNAILVIAGDIDVPAAQALVKKYFAWIPSRSPDTVLLDKHPAEPDQTESRRVELKQRVPLPQVMIAWHVPPYASEDQYAIGVLSNILSAGASSRLDRLLVNGEHPLCVDVFASDWPMEDGGLFVVGGKVLTGRDPAQVEKILTDAITELIEKGVTAEELAKAKTGVRVSTVRGHETAEQIASGLGEDALLAADPNRMNTDLAKIEAVTAEQVQAVAKKYLRPDRTTTLRITPDPLAPLASLPTSAPASAPASQPITPRDIKFPENWPSAPPLAGTPIKATFEKGDETEIAGVKVIVMPDHRLPLVSWTLAIRQGSLLDPQGREGVSAITAEMLSHGAGDKTYAQLTDDLDSHGISLWANDSGDTTRLGGSCMTDQLDHATDLMRQMLLSPTFPEEEFAKVKERSLNQLQDLLQKADAAGTRMINQKLYAGSPQGRQTTMLSLESIKLADVKAWYAQRYSPKDAILVISGDVSVERGQELAKKVLAGWKMQDVPALAEAGPNKFDKRQIIVIHRPEGRQSTVRMAIGAYDIRSDEKFAGALANRILSAGIDSRLGKYVRAEKGYAYSVWGVFSPGRHGGQFEAGTETAFPSTAAAIEAMFKVFNDMRKADVTKDELADAKLRVAGGMVMGMQTIEQQASYRLEGILNNYPADYYDKYPQRINEVTAEQVKAVMEKYVRDDQMLIVVVAPATAVTEQLEKLGEVKIGPMPLAVEPATTKP